MSMWSTSGYGEYFFDEWHGFLSTSFGSHDSVRQVSPDFFRFRCCHIVYCLTKTIRNHWKKKKKYKKLFIWILTKLEVKIKIFQKSMKYRGKLQRFGAKVQVVGDFQLLWKFPKFGIFGLQKRVFLL